MDHKNITIKANTYVYLVILLLLIPIQWLFAWLVTMLFHELCHWIAVKLCGAQVYQLVIGIGGMDMESSPLSDGKRLFAVLSGPIGGFLLVFLGRWFPRVALCSWMLSMYNLLPLLPLDGGRALQIILRNKTAFFVVEKCILILLTFACAYVAFSLRLGVLPLAIVAGLWLKNRKRPCKASLCKVQ